MPLDLSAWGLPAPEHVRRPERGTNNLVWLIDESYVLRVYLNLDVARIEAELRLLTALRARGGLPFAVPEPIADLTGRTVPTHDGPAVLFPYLAGRPGDRTNLSDIELAGEALGQLDIALAELPDKLAPVDWRVCLDGVHPAVPSVADLCVELDALLPNHDGVRCLREGAATVDADYLRLVGELPAQITHGDLATSNILIAADGQVSGVLDFEVTGVDIRVNDIVAGLAMAVDWGTGRQEAQRAAFERGYQHVIELESAELAAIPLLLHRRTLGSLIWRAGRWRLGLSDLDDVRDRLNVLAYSTPTA